MQRLFLHAHLTPKAAMRLRLGSEHPDILADAARTVRDEKCVACRGTARQSAGHNLVIVASGDGKGAQDSIAWFAVMVDKGWGCGKADLLLPHILFRLGEDALAQRLQFFCTELCPQQCGGCPAARNAPNHQRGKVLKHVVHLFLLTTPPGRSRRQFEIFAQKIACHTGHKGHQPWIFEHTAAQWIDDRHILPPRRFQQSSHPQARICTQFERIAEAIIDTAQNDIDRLQPAQRFQRQAAIAHSEVVALHQRIAEIGGEIGMFKVGFVVGTGGEDDRAWQLFVLEGTLCQRVLQGAKVVGESLDFVVTKGTLHETRHHRAIFQRIARTRRCLCAVTDNPHLPIRSPRQIGAIENQLLFVGQS